MGEEILRLAGELDARGEPYAFATVVAVDRPVSARQSDRAIVFADGRLRGWVGGSCSEPIVIRESLAALEDGNARLVRIRPPGAPREQPRPGVITEVTTCASEGGLDIFVEPRRARLRIAIVGSSPVARTLAQLAATIGYRVIGIREDPGEGIPAADDISDLHGLMAMDLGAEDAVVIATMNRYDEAALVAAAGTEAGYVGLVASRPRGRKVIAMAANQGIDGDRLERVRCPAGLDLGPGGQEEIAVAVLAEVVADQHRMRADRANARMCPPSPAEAVDPVCGMSVAVVEGAVSADQGGTTWYFCSPSCRAAFVAKPDLYLRSAAGH